MNNKRDTSADTQVAQLITHYRSEAGALLPLLHAVQDTLGYIPEASVPAIAQGLNLSRAEVHGVISYYHFFRSEPAGRHKVQVCLAESCRACGSEALMHHAEKATGCRNHHTRDDGAVTLEPVYCLGLCAQSPAMMVNDTPHANMSPEKLSRLLQQLGVTGVTP